LSKALRKTMVYLGLADEEYDQADQTPAKPAAVAVHPAPQAHQHTPSSDNDRAPVTPLRHSGPSKIADSVDMNEILTVHPRQYKDAQLIAESFRDGIPVIINLSQMSEAEARRLVDFASGLSQGLYGKIERVTKQVFLLSPAHVVVSGEHSSTEAEAEASFFTQA
jgi:cell division inhibitor SepF